jgi:hypothetical protein
MKILNVDKFTTKYTVVIEGKEFTVRAMSVKQFSELDIANKLANSDEKSLIKVMVEVLKAVSDIPEETLWDQEFRVLSMLLGIAQGQDPDEAEKDTDEKN